MNALPMLWRAVRCFEGTRMFDKSWRSNNFSNKVCSRIVPTLQKAWRGTFDPEHIAPHIGSDVENTEWTRTSISQAG